MKFKIGLFLAAALLSLGVQAEDKTAPSAPQAMLSGLKAEIKMGTGLENREPVGVADSFDMSVGKVIGWSRLDGAESPLKISHVWIYKGNEIASVPLEVPQLPYRTYSRKTVTGFPGSWTFQVKDEAGQLLAEKSFEVTDSAAIPQ